MKLEEYCIQLVPLKLPSIDQALAVLWFHDQKSEGCLMLPGTLARHIHESGLGNPNSTNLATALKKSTHTLSKSKGFRLKPTGRNYIAAKVQAVLRPITKVENSNGFLPENVWQNTQGYIEAIASQVNGCYQYGFYDGASVLARRLVETLLIEVYEHKKCESRIRAQDGNYVMLSGIIKDAVNGGISLGRGSQKHLKDIKEAGDRAAHNRHYTAGKPDLDKLQSGFRLVVGELISLAELQRV